MAYHSARAPTAVLWLVGLSCRRTMSSQNLLSMAGTKACLHSSGDKLYEEVKALTTGSEAPMRRDVEGASELQSSPATPIPPHVSSEGIQRRESDSAGLAAPYVSSQAHLLKPSDYNPMPTAVPLPPVGLGLGLGSRCRRPDLER